MFTATLILAGHGGVIAMLAAFAAVAFGTMITAPQAQPIVPSTSPDQDSIVAQAENLKSQFEVLTGTTDVIQGGGGSLSSLGSSGGAVPIAGVSFIKTAGVNATTLAAPVAGNPSQGGNDNLDIVIIDCGGHAHTVTAPANSINGNKHVITFPGTVGAQIKLKALNGVWYTDGGGTTLT